MVRITHALGTNRRSPNDLPPLAFNTASLAALEESEMLMGIPSSRSALGMSMVDLQSEPSAALLGGVSSKNPLPRMSSFSSKVSRTAFLGRERRRPNHPLRSASRRRRIGGTAGALSALTLSSPHRCC